MRERQTDRQRDRQRERQTERDRNREFKSIGIINIDREI